MLINITNNLNKYQKLMPTLLQVSSINPGLTKQLFPMKFHKTWMIFLVNSEEKSRSKELGFLISCEILINLDMEILARITSDLHLAWPSFHFLNLNLNLYLTTSNAKISLALFYGTTLWKRSMKCSISINYKNQLLKLLNL